GEVEVGEEDEILAQELVLLLDGFLDLEHELAGGPGLGGVGSDVGPGAGILLIGDERSFAGCRLHGGLMTVGDELVDTGCGDGDSVLVVLVLGLRWIARSVSVSHVLSSEGGSVRDRRRPTMSPTVFPEGWQSKPLWLFSSAILRNPFKREPDDAKNMVPDSVGTP